MRRDLAALAEFGADTLPGLPLWDQLQETSALTAKALRRKLPIEDLARIRAQLEALLDEARTIIDGSDTEEMDTSDAHFEQHHPNTRKDSDESEAGEKFASMDVAQKPEEVDDKPVPKIPLRLVIASCPTLKTFYHGEIRHWHQLYDAACHIRPSMGINNSAWEEALRYMGPEQASIVLVAMLERFAEIRSPGGYLRALAQKAAAGEFSCGPMLMALIGRQKAA